MKSSDVVLGGTKTLSILIKKTSKKHTNRSKSECGWLKRFEKKMDLLLRRKVWCRCVWRRPMLERPVAHEDPM
jgi:hypothetical protein